MKITIIGTGYVGLVSGVCLSEIGHDVTCIDSNPKIVNALKRGKVTFYEPGMKKLILKNIQRKRLKFTNSYKIGTEKSNIFFICVGTPSNKNGSCNTKYIKNVAKSLAKSIHQDSIIFVKSTVPVGTCKLVENITKKYQSPKINIDIASNPEFLREGDAINDFMKPDRILVGTKSKYVKKISRKIYKTLITKSRPIIFLPTKASELSKYASNSFLATKISYMNELSLLTDRYNINIDDIKDAMSYDPRIGKHFLKAGLGFGGSCFPKDLASLKHTFIENNIKPSIISAIIDVNNNQRKKFLEKIYTFYKGKNLSKKNILVWGLSFKPNTDDTRESQAIKIIEKLSKKVNHLYLYDPRGIPNAKKDLINVKNTTYIKNQYQNISNCDAILLCTDWDQFLKLDIDKIKKLNDRVIFDGRNVLNKSMLESNEIAYECLGN